jgi:probable HAF family extracellular repeat protein
VKAAIVFPRVGLVIQRVARPSLRVWKFRQRSALGEMRSVILLSGLGLIAAPFTLAQEVHPPPAQEVHQSAAPEVHPRYAVVDRGPALVRTDTPGFNNRGDVAIWHSVTASEMPGWVLHGKDTISIEGDKDFSLVYPADINDRLTVVGTLQQPQDLRFTQAFKWSNDHLQLLKSLGGAYSTAGAINAAGDVVGSAQTTDGTRHAVLWQARASQPRDLGLLAQGDFSRAHDINDKNEIVGEANLVPKGKPQAFLWRAGKMQQLPTLPGGTVCSAQAINNNGVIAGWCDLRSGAAHGVIWKDGSIVDLGSLHGDEDEPSTAWDINSHGQVVGSSGDDRLRAFLWENGKMVNLNKLIPPDSGWTLLVASRINDKGQIIGRGYFHRTIHTFALEPDQTVNKK